MDVINIINLWKREDRLLHLCNEAKVQGFAFKLWEGIEEFNTSAMNINKAHKRIVQWAKDNKMKKVFIAEDDIVFSAPGAWDYFRSKEPDSFDLFYSMIYSGQIEGNRIMNGFSGMTLYVVNERFYDFFLSIPDHVHIDRWLGQYAFEKEYYVCDPFVARQMGGYSDNLKMSMTYQAFEEKMNFFGYEKKVS